MDEMDESRRSFLVQAALAAAGIAGAALPSKAQAGPIPALQKPITWKVLRNSVAKSASATLPSMEIELTGANGVRQVHNSTGKLVNVKGGQELTLTTTITTTDPATGQTEKETKVVFTSIVHGPVVEGQRTDTTTVTIIDSTGTHQKPPMSVKVTPRAFANLSPAQLVDTILTQKLG